MTTDDGVYRVRPYARLLTMLGEQLIKNDRIALVELIKNCYDADATQVTIAFEGFGANMVATPESRIVISDNGTGMSLDVVRDHWLNPATDVKHRRKKKGKTKTAGGRIIQGEKGIGRFAMFKLGSAVEMVTRAHGQTQEVLASLDIGFLDEDEFDESEDAMAESTAGDDDTDTSVARYLDEVEAMIALQVPTKFVTGGSLGVHGTQLAISGLRGTWNERALRQLHDDIVRLQPLKGLLTGEAGEDPLAFDVTYRVNGSKPEGLTNPQERLDNLTPQAVLRVIGNFSSENNTFELLVNDEERKFAADSDDVRASHMYGRAVDSSRQPHKFVCGDFEFEFLVFDLRPNIEDARYHLDQADKELIKEHRIYLYRDDVRVLPYGDRDDDWLQLDIIRGTVGANRVLSNDQIIGFVYISQEKNPFLRDKTNREGLIDSGASYKDFIALIQLLVSYLRREDYQRYLFESRARSEARDIRETDVVDQRLTEVRRLVEGLPAARAVMDGFSKAYETERRVMSQRIERTEDLAGVGLSVETASHDVVASANQASSDAKVLVEQLSYELGKAHAITQRAIAVELAISFIVSRLQDVQGLFVSTKTRARRLDVLRYARKIKSIYRKALSDNHIEISLQGDGEIFAMTHEATLLQIFLNLVDNSIFWLRLSNTHSPQITIEADEGARTITFSDNGPGIKILDAPYIFDPFFSAKGDEGRGLGLYIARQVARRDRLDLELVMPPMSRLDERIPARFVLHLGDEES